MKQKHRAYRIKTVLKTLKEPGHHKLQVYLCCCWITLKTLDNYLAAETIKRSLEDRN